MKITPYAFQSILIAFTFFAAPRPTWAAPVRPNILFILTDDLGWADVGADNPKTFYETPAIDALSKSGLRFTAGYAACPVCSPSRAAILTGQYPPRTGITDFIGAKQPQDWKRPTKLLPAPYAEQLALEKITLAEALKAAGYATFIAGKWHLGPQGYWPENQGFEINKGGTSAGAPSAGGGYFPPYKNPRLPDGPANEYLTDRLAEETVKFIDDHRDRPFFAYLSFYAVHIPLMSRPDILQKYQDKKKRLGLDTQWGTEGKAKVRLNQSNPIYAGMVESVDHGVDRVLQELDRLGLADHTIVIFTSDNGGLATAEGQPTSNLPLRGGKGWLYEGGVREPLIVRAPGVTHPGTTCDEPVIGTDFFPTLLELANVKIPAGDKVDGLSFVPLLRGEDFKRGPIFWHYPHYGNQGGSPGGAVRDGDWKLIEWFEDQRVELYNIKSDIGEHHDLARTQPAKTRELLQELSQWQKNIGAKMPTVNPIFKAKETSALDQPDTRNWMTVED